MTHPHSAKPFLDTLYADLLERGYRYFFPTISLTLLGESDVHRDAVQYRKTNEALTIDWLGLRYALETNRPLATVQERKLMKSVSLVLSARYRLLFDRDLASQALDLFRGLPEDRYVSAFLDSSPYADATAQLQTRDRIADAIEVLRISALSTYENRRIVTGVLIFGLQPDPCHIRPPNPEGAMPYSTALTSLRSFHRLCDGLQTLALVDEQGLLVEIVDLMKWTEVYSGFDLPVPGPALYESHCRATLCGGHTCLVLTPNGEIKIFSEGAQVFNFIDGRWRLTNAVEKYRLWREGLGNELLAERLFRVAANLAEERRGGLFVVLEDSAYAERLLAPGDLLCDASPTASARPGVSKDQLHYLLRNRSILEMPATVIESIARIDGGIVIGQDYRLLAFGAILRLGSPAETEHGLAEGGRTTAAIGASRFGHVLKVSEDGMVSYFHSGACVWEM